MSLAIAQWLSQSPTRQGNSLTGANCALPGTLTATGLSSGHQSGALGWGAPKGNVSCTIQGSGRHLRVRTSTDGVTFVDGERQ
ncbi:hypothetical protein [Deinococcus wulumuqiensis]|uniref:Uncharacterized protein n=1 Tax=Deinococcus wulumuqiensis TaxID=980427 RepID=A0AAV4K9A3_9DEIO|nr:hypothetical protein [Deinococcus wulumuqiensis]QII22469.1 hypothetical protein G6R31_16585 [Deinococcus wulumuqiensis R12]GGI87893.1 hypothetical protein GCM10010914_22860 [Deinococcus wulumuqiensis]GGP30293.1 hypothetical protein GCM10008021_19440 [Deinococcus wulumuqiensis]